MATRLIWGFGNDSKMILPRIEKGIAKLLKGIGEP